MIFVQLLQHRDYFLIFRCFQTNKWKLDQVKFKRLPQKLEQNSIVCRKHTIDGKCMSANSIERKDIKKYIKITNSTQQKTFGVEKLLFPDSKMVIMTEVVEQAMSTGLALHRSLLLEKTEIEKSAITLVSNECSPVLDYRGLQILYQVNSTMFSHRCDHYNKTTFEVYEKKHFLYNTQTKLCFSLPLTHTHKQMNSLPDRDSKTPWKESSGQNLTGSTKSYHFSLVLVVLVATWSVCLWERKKQDFHQSEGPRVPVTYNHSGLVNHRLYSPNFYWTGHIQILTSVSGQSKAVLQCCFRFTILWLVMPRQNLQVNFFNGNRLRYLACTRTPYKYAKKLKSISAFCWFQDKRQIDLVPVHLV